MSPPLIDKRAAVELRRIERDATALLAKVRALPDHVKTRRGRPALERASVGLLDSCAGEALPPPPALAALLAELLVGTDKTGNRRREVRTVTREQLGRATAYFSTLPEGTRPTVNALAKAAGISWGKARELFSDNAFRAEANAERWCRENPDEAERARAEGGDFLGMRSHGEWQAARNAALRGALERSNATSDAPQPEARRE